MADVCKNDVYNQQIKQLEIEYIFKRETSDRHFTKEEIYRDMANLSRVLIEYHNKSGKTILNPSRLTKFAWLTGQKSR